METKLAQDPEVVELLKDFKVKPRRGVYPPYVLFLGEAVEKPLSINKKIKRLKILYLDGGHGQRHKLDYYHRKGFRIVKWELPQESLRNNDGRVYNETPDGRSPFGEIGEHLRYLTDIQDGIASKAELEALRAEKKGLEARAKEFTEVKNETVTSGATRAKAKAAT